MASATQHPNHQLISSEDVEGTEVYDPSGKNIGEVDHLMSLGGFRTNISETQLKDAPEFSDDSWGDRDWEARTHKHYAAPTYW